MAFRLEGRTSAKKKESSPFPVIPEAPKDAQGNEWYPALLENFQTAHEAYAHKQAKRRRAALTDARDALIRVAEKGEGFDGSKGRVATMKQFLAEALHGILEFDQETAQESTANKEIFAALHPVNFSTGRFFIGIGGTEYRIVNAKEHYLLPGDRVRTEQVGATEVAVTKVAYEGRGTVVGRIEKESDASIRKEGRTAEERRLQFVIRAPGAEGTFEKFILPTEDITKTVPDLARLESTGELLVFNRSTRTLEETPAAAKRAMTPYEQARFTVLTNLDIEQHDAEAEALKEDEAEQARELMQQYHVSPRMRGEAVREAAAPVLRAQIEKEIAAGAIRDMRDDAKRVTFYVDNKSTRDHDDAFSIRPLGEEESPKTAAEEGRWYEIGIHIADPRRFVSAGSPLDLGAAERGSSIYLPEDFTLRMLPRIVSEHLGSLHEGQDRFAVSLIFKARRTSKKGIEVQEVVFTPSAIRVTDGLSYDDADYLLTDRGYEEGGRTAKAWSAFSDIMNALHMRTAVRKPGQTGAQPLEDAHDTVQMGNEFFNRLAGVSFERYKRSNLPQLGALQDLVLGVYRNRSIDVPSVQDLALEQFQEAGLLTAEDTGSFMYLSTVARRRAEAGNMLKQFDAIMGEAKKAAVLTYSSEPRGHVDFGKNFTRMSSPLRRYADFLALRSHTFLQKLNEQGKAAGEGDISEIQLRALVEEYATEVIGMRLPAGSGNMKTSTLMDIVAEQAKKYVDTTLEHAQNRELLARHTERAMMNVRTLDVLAAAVAKKPVALPQGIAVDFTDGKRRPTVENGAAWAYGKASISRRKNRSLLQYTPRRSGDTVRLGVKFILPKGMKYPSASTATVQGTIQDVEVDKGRIVLAVTGITDSDTNTKQRKTPERKSQDF